MTNHKQIATDLAALPQMPGQLAILAAQYRRKWQEILAEAPYVPAPETQRQLQRAKDEHRQDIGRIRVQALEAQARIQRAAEQAKGEAGRHDDPARAILEQRAWNRILPILQHQPSYIETVARAQEMIAAAGRQRDLATIRAFATELPAYLEANEPADQRARRQAVGKSFAEADGTVRALLDAVAQAGAQLLPPEERLAYDLERQLQPFDAAILGNCERLEMALDDPTGRSAVTGLIGWEPSTYLPAGSATPVPANPASTPPEEMQPDRVPVDPQMMQGLASRRRFVDEE